MRSCRTSGIFLALIFILLLACGTSQSEVPLRSRFKISGVLQLSETQRNAAAQDPLRVALVSPEGERKVLGPDKVSIDPKSGGFSFSVSRSDFHARLGETPAEWLAAQGQLNPLRSLPSRGFRDNGLGYLRFEIYSPLETSTAGVVPVYAQNYAQLPVMSRFKDSDTISVGSVLVPETVGLVSAKVIDIFGNAVSNALLTVIPLKAQGTSEGDAQLLDFTSERNFTPIGTYSDRDGRALLWPAPYDVNGKKQFQVIASAMTYCTSTSKPLSGASIREEITVVLQPCTEEQRNARSPDWEVTLLTPMQRLSAATATLPAGTWLTRLDEAQFAFTDRSSVKRGFVVTTYEGVSTEGTPVARVVYNTSFPLVRVPLPTAFKGGTSTRGSFVIQFESLLSEKDRAAGMAPTRKSFVFDKWVRNPAAVPAARFQVLSLTGSENVVAGDQLGAFVLKYLDCSEGIKIGVVFSETGTENPQPVWQTCSPSGNRFNTLPTSSALSGQGGFKTAQFFIRDRYENISRDDRAASVNWRSNVWIDFGRPNVEALQLGEHIDVLPATTSLPVNADQAVVILTPANVHQHVLAVRQGQCSAFLGVNPAADGNDTTLMRGHKLSKIYAGRTLSGDDMLAAGVACEGGGFALNTTAVNFPDLASTDPATVSLTVFDLSGQFSSRTVSIPRCTGTPPTPSENVCWSPQ